MNFVAGFALRPIEHRFVRNQISLMEGRRRRGRRRRRRRRRGSFKKKDSSADTILARGET